MKPTTPSKRQPGAPTPFKIVKDPLPADRYHKALNGKRTYFADALQALARAPRGSALEFASRGCYQQVLKAAKKLGYTLHFAEQDGKLYCQLLDTGEDK